MRVLHVYPGSLYGGIETFLASIARRRHLHEQDEVTHDFALCFPGRLMDELRDAGASVFELGPARLSRPWTVLRARRNLVNLLRDQPRYDVVICHSFWAHALFGPIVRSAGMPLVFYLHGPIGDPTWLDRRASRTRPDLLIAVSRHSAESAKKLFGDVVIAIVGHPLPSLLESLHRLPHREVNEHEVILLQVSRMEAWKGHELHLKALEKLMDLPNWSCWIAGGAQRPKERAYLARLKRIAMQSGLQHRVKFLGQRSDVPQLLRQAHIFCQPNRDPEGFGLVFVEAMAAGLPVVTTRMGPAPEIIDDASGILVNPGDADELAGVLRRLIKDPSLRQELGRGGQRRVGSLCDPQARMADLHAALRSVARRRQVKQPSVTSVAGSPKGAAGDIVRR